MEDALPQGAWVCVVGGTDTDAQTCSGPEKPRLVASPLQLCRPGLQTCPP